ncbi:M4 family metallopeptidase [Kitasatospora sp. NPDC057692]|uniref:M4 family metallopeptidase n=1 Tax=Kitasatospora sp. NPDC057692 TaxID=3346215 RepID=UPI003682E822
MPRLSRSARTWAVATVVAALAPAVPPALAAAAPAPDGDPVPALVAGLDTAAPQLVTGLSEPAPGEPAAAALAHLAAHPDRYRVDPGELTELGTTEGPDGRRTVRFEQRHGGVPVLGGQYLVRLTGQGAEQTVESAGGRYFTALTAPTAAAVSAEELRRAALGDLDDARDRAGAGVEDLGPVVLPDGPGLLAERFVLHPASGRAREVFVDATTGAVVLAHDTRAPRPEPAAAATAPDEGLQPATGTAPEAHGRTVAVNLARRPGGGYQFTDLTRSSVISTYDAAGADFLDYQRRMPAGAVPLSSATPDFPAVAGSSGATDAHVNAGLVHDFFRDRLGRNGLDGKGGAIVSVVNVTDLGTPFPNAFWDKTKMVYGNGPGQYPFPVALDVAAHEMTHGVVQNTADFFDLGQPGAMNEAIADYFGNAVEVTARGIAMDDPTAPLLGESLCPTGTPQACAERRLDDRRTTVADFLGTRHELDAGGVHLNATIFGGALWDIRRTLDPLIADRLVYRALADYLTPLDDFVAGRNAVLAAGRDLGLTKRQLRTVAAAFDAHGIKEGWQKRIGIDSRTLLRDVTTGMAAPAAARGRWVMRANGPAGTGLYAGALDGRGTPVRLSPEDGRTHSWAATDGTNAAWLAKGGSDPRAAQEVMTAPLSGTGPVRSVFRSTTEQVNAVRISGADLAFTASSNGRAVPHLSRGGGAPVALPLPEGHSATDLVLRDGLLGWIEIWQEGERLVTVPTLYSLATGTVTARFPEHAPAGSGPSLAVALALAGGRLLWLDLPDDHAVRGTIRSAAPDGSGVVDLLSADSPQAPRTGPLAVSDQAVTFRYENERKPAGGWTNAALPKLWQIPLAGGGAPQRVSCDRGGQYEAAADEGTRVVWLDATAGTNDLVVRERPAGGC